MPRKRKEPYITYFDTGFLPGYFGFTEDPKAFAKEMERLAIPRPPTFLAAGGHASTHHFTGGKFRNDVISIVTLTPPAERKRMGITPAQVAAMVAHEAVHVWQENKEWMRESAPGREIEAYAIQYFTQCMLKELRK